MISVLVQFTLPQPVTLEQAQGIFLASAPTYRDVAGLLRKYYVLSEDGTTAGGIYLWKSREDAARLYTKEWKSMVRERYGVDPSLTYFYTPVVVDNVLQQIVGDEGA